MLAFSESMGCAQSNSGHVLVGAQDTSSSPPLDATTILDSTTSAQTCGRDERADNPKRTCTDDGGARKVWADCIICDEESDIQCDEGHPICRECLEKYVLENVEKLRKTDYLPAKAETAQISEDGATLAFLRGACSCPLRGHGCGAPPFGDRLIALNVSDHAFAQYSEGKALLPIARKVDQVVQEGSELALLMPNARMCARCHYGPVELAAGSCDDLRMHHGEVRAPGRAPVSNACPNCGWFAETIHAWPRWVRQTTAEEATWATVHAAQENSSLQGRRRGEPPGPARPPGSFPPGFPTHLLRPGRDPHFGLPTHLLRPGQAIGMGLAVGMQVGYGGYGGCTVAVLHADGSIDVNVPGIGIHEHVHPSAIAPLAPGRAAQWRHWATRQGTPEEAHLAMSEALVAAAERRAAARAEAPGRAAARAEALGQLHNNQPVSTQSAAAVAGDQHGLYRYSLRTHVDGRRDGHMDVDHLLEMMDDGLDPDERRRLHREHRDALREMRRQRHADQGLPRPSDWNPFLGQTVRDPDWDGVRDQLHSLLPPALPAMPSASERLEYDLAQARAERQAYEGRVHTLQRQRDEAIAAAIAAAPRDGRNPNGPPTRVAASLPPAGPQATDRARSLALLARLTGFEEGSQACAFYLDEAGGDVEAAVRAAVQGASLASPSSHPAIVAAVAAGRRDE